MYDDLARTTYNLSKHNKTYFSNSKQIKAIQNSPNKIPSLLIKMSFNNYIKLIMEFPFITKQLIQVKSTFNARSHSRPHCLLHPHLGMSPSRVGINHRTQT